MYGYKSFIAEIFFSFITRCYLLCRKYLKRDIIISQDGMYGLIEYVVISVSSILMTFKQLIFLKDMKSSLKVRLIYQYFIPAVFKNSIIY